MDHRARSDYPSARGLRARVPNLVDLGIPLGPEPLPVAAIVLFERGTLGRIRGRFQPRLVQDLLLGDFRFVEIPDLGDRRLLRIGQRARFDPRVGVALSIVQGLILLLLVPFYWPLIGLR